MVERSVVNALATCVLLGILTAVLQGCSAFATRNDDDPEASEQTTKVDIHAPFPVVYRTGIEQIKLIELLAGETEGQRIMGLRRQSPPHDYLPWSTKYDLAFAAFYNRLPGNVEAQKIERNRIQERILGASDQRCRMFTVNLQRDQSRTNFWFGALATVSGALGAVANGVQAAKNLAATSGVLSGLRAEYNQAFYANLLFSVISKGIHERRNEAYRQIQQEGQSKPIAAYPVEAAVKDAIVYDGLCNTAVGLQQAQDSIRLAQDPGIDTLNRLIIKANKTHEIVEKKLTDLSELEKAGMDPRAGSLTPKDGRLEFGSYLRTGDPGEAVQIAVVAQTEKSKIEKAIQTGMDRLQLPPAIPATDKAILVEDLRAKINPSKEALFGRFHACVKDDGAESVKRLVQAQSDVDVAGAGPDKERAVLIYKERLAQLELLANKMRQLSAQFMSGLDAYNKQVATDLAKATKLSEVSTGVDALTKNQWSFGDPKKCSS